MTPDGDDSHAGTESQPWKTLREAAAAVQPGDMVRIKAGDYFVGPTWIVNRAGTAKSPITYRAFGDGEVRITGSSLLPPEKMDTRQGRHVSTSLDGRSWPCSDLTHCLGPGRQSDLQQRFLRRGKAGRNQPELDRQPRLPQHIRRFHVCRRVSPGQGGEPCTEQHRPGCRRSLLVWPDKALPQTLDRNLYYNAAAALRWERDDVAYQAFADYQQAAGETHSRDAAPQLVGPADAHLQTDSPAIDVGLAQNEVTVDIEGVCALQAAACDIGAYEFKVNTK